MDAYQEEGRPRILLREFKKRRYPKRWDSLPCLQLSPENRPLFVCHRCNFPNPICALCPWCLCEAPAAAPVAVVRRRVSSPTLLTDAQKMQLATLERRTRAARGGGAVSGLATSSPDPRATRDPLAGANEAGADVTADGLSVRRKHRNAVFYSATDVVATATEDTTLRPFLDQIAAAHFENRERSRQSSPSVSSTPPPSVRTSRSPSTRVSRPETLRNSSPPNSHARMPEQHADSVHASEPRSSTPSPEASAPPSPLAQTCQTPCLRRKRRMSTLRQRSSCSLRRRATASSSGTCRRESAASPPSSPRPKTATSLAATSPPGSPRSKTSTSIRFSTPPPGSAKADAIPLGHPQRPLYTAIRKNMSRPESPTPSTTQAHVDLVVFERARALAARGTRSLDIDVDADAHAAASGNGGAEVQQRFGSLTRASHLVVTRRPALFASASGFSVSGETELRMDLARSRSMDGVPSDYAFREVRRRRRDGAQDASVKERVKSFGKTLKGLLRVKI